MGAPRETDARTVLITGGTSGIGRSAVTLFLKRGWRVFELSRRATTDLEGVRHLSADIADPDSVRKAVETVLSESGRIDALVNNAGSGIFGAAETTDPESFRRQFEVNFFGAVNLTQLVLPVMRNAGRGNIVNVASLAAFFPLPYQSFYSATKAALVTWSRALAGEVEPLGIRVACVCPGDVRTGFTAARQVGDSPSKNGDSPSADAQNAYENAQKRALGKVEKSENGGLSPEIIAREIVEFAESRRPPLVAIPGIGYAWLDRLARLLPRTLVSRLIAKLYI